MAREWIKLRVWLDKDPKVILMTDILAESRRFMNWLTDPVQRHCRESAYEHVTRNVLRHVVVTGLLHVWGVANEEGTPDGDDLVIRHASSDTLEDIAEIPDFGFAMVEVGWAVEEEGLLRFPKFLVHNIPLEDRPKTNAERQRDYRNRKRNEKVTRSNAKVTRRDVTSVVTSNDSTVHNSTDIKTGAAHPAAVAASVTPEPKTPPAEADPKPPPKNPKSSAFDPPPELDTPEARSAWTRWLDYLAEKKKRYPSTAAAHAEKLRAMGPARAAAAIAHSIARGWNEPMEPDAARDPPGGGGGDWDEKLARAKARVNGRESP